MVGKLSRLPAETQTALQLMACLGNAAKIAMLSIVLEVSAEQVESALWEAIRQELIEPLEGSYRFMHDRVQEAAYSLIPEERRTGVHLRIGELLAANTPPQQRDEAVFDIVNHLNRGAALITAPDKREQLAELNLIAGKRAKAATAYASALTYLNAGAALLVEDCWEHQHELIFQLELHRAECEFQCPGGGAALECALDPRREYVGTSHRRLLAGGPVHEPRSEQPCHCRRARLPPTSGDRLVAASDRRGSKARIRADLVTAREPHDRGSDRAAFDERPVIPRDAGCSDQARTA
jgi:hypothetical protein